MIAVVQITYLSLITLSKLNPCFKALNNIWFVHGFNYFHSFKKYLMDSSLPIQFKGIGLFAKFT